MEFVQTKKEWQPKWAAILSAINLEALVLALFEVARGARPLADIGLCRSACTRRTAVFSVIDVSPGGLGIPLRVSGGRIVSNVALDSNRVGRRAR